MHFNDDTIGDFLYSFITAIYSNKKHSSFLFYSKYSYIDGLQVKHT